MLYRVAGRLFREIFPPGLGKNDAEQQSKRAADWSEASTYRRGGSQPMAGNGLGYWKAASMGLRLIKSMA